MTKYLFLPFLFFTVVSCVNYSYSPDVVSRSDAQRTQYVVLGTIVDINSVTIEGDREIGAYAGAFIGGAAGKNILILNWNLMLQQYLEVLLVLPLVLKLDQI